VTLCVSHLFHQGKASFRRCDRRSSANRARLDHYPRLALLTIAGQTLGSLRRLTDYSCDHFQTRIRHGPLLATAQRVSTRPKRLRSQWLIRSAMLCSGHSDRWSDTGRHRTRRRQY